MKRDQDLRELFESLIDLPASEREAALEESEASAAQRRRLRDMLAVEDELSAAGSTGSTESPGRRRDHPWPGDEVGAYRLVAPIGDGGMGSVWMAVSRSAANVMVAVKFAHASRVGIEEAKGRLRQEQDVLTLLDHPNVVSVVDAGTTDSGAPFLAMEIARGKPLDVWAREQSPSTAARLGVLRSIGSALDHVHARGILHRDLKPSNVLVSEEGWPTLIDFGIARITGESPIQASYLTQGGAPHTPAFSSPEQRDGGETSTATDVFGFGKLARELMAPLRAMDTEGVDAELDAVLDRACADEPTRRFAAAGELSQALDEWAAQRGSLPHRSLSVAGRLGLASLVGIAGAAGWFAGSRGVAAPPTEPVDGPAHTMVLLNALKDSSAFAISGDPDGFAAAAVAADEPGLFVLAAYAHAREDDVKAARASARRALDQRDRLSPLRASELSELLLRMGCPEGSLLALEAIQEDEHDSHQGRWADRLYLEFALARPEAAQPLTEELDRWLGELMDQQGQDEASVLQWLAGEPQGSPYRGTFLLLISAGHRPSVEAWMERAKEQPIVDLQEAPSSELNALLTLHAGLFRRGASSALPDELLADLEQEAQLRSVEGDPYGIELWARCREIRVLEQLEHPIDRARDLSGVGSTFLSNQPWASTSARYRLEVLRTQAAAIGGDMGAARAMRAEAVRLATEAFGEDAWQTSLVSSAEPAEIADESLMGVLLDSPEDLAEAVRAFDDPSASAPPWLWWFRAP